MFRFVLDRKIYKQKRNTFCMQKRGQLGIIEFKYFMVGLLVGIVIALVLVMLGTKGILPFKIPLVC